MPHKNLLKRYVNLQKILKVKMILSEDKAKKCHICNEKFVDGDKNLFYRNV